MVMLNEGDLAGATRVLRVRVRHARRQPRRRRHAAEPAEPARTREERSAPRQRGAAGAQPLRRRRERAAAGDGQVREPARAKGVDHRRRLPLSAELAPPRLPSLAASWRAAVTQQWQPAGVGIETAAHARRRRHRDGPRRLGQRGSLGGSHPRLHHAEDRRSRRRQRDLHICRLEEFAQVGATTASTVVGARLRRHAEEGRRAAIGSSRDPRDTSAGGSGPAPSGEAARRSTDGGAAAAAAPAGVARAQLHFRGAATG